MPPLKRELRSWAAQVCKPMKLTGMTQNTLIPNTMTYTKISYFTCAVGGGGLCLSLSLNSKETRRLPVASCHELGGGGQLACLRAALLATLMPNASCKRRRFVAILTPVIDAITRLWLRARIRAYHSMCIISSDGHNSPAKGRASHTPVSEMRHRAWYLAHCQTREVAELAFGWSLPDSTARTNHQGPPVARK